MRARKHIHPCDGCGNQIECSGDLVQNYDGFPEVVCRDYHDDSRGARDWLCEDCREKAEAAYAKDLAEQEGANS